jgi:hypothetical protein
MRRWAVVAIAAVLAGCNQDDAQPDFGASMVARQFGVAEAQCEQAGMPDLQACIASPDRDARLSAKTALSMRETFYNMCIEVAGSKKCDDMLTRAFVTAAAK